MPFASLGLRPTIAKAVAEAGYTTPTPIQSKAIPTILQGRDLIGAAQTGTGKTAAFVLPMLEKLGGRGADLAARALIVAPTRELVVQIEENLRAYARHLRIRSVMVYGGVGEQPQIASLRRGVDIIVATPGRLLDLMARKHVRLDRLEILVLDEADRMLDMGFMPSIRRIVAAVPKNRQTMLFSATISKEIEQIASDFLRDPVTIQVAARSKPADGITQIVHEVPHDQKQDLLHDLLRDGDKSSVLVFSRTKHGADRIARRLAQAGYVAATIHSNRSQAQRIRALESFRAGKVRVLVATDIAARGIDVDGISHVINFDFPHIPEDYVHRIGRTGRAEAVGEAISFVSPEDYANLRKVESVVGRRIERKAREGFVIRRSVTSVVSASRGAAARGAAHAGVGRAAHAAGRSAAGRSSSPAQRPGSRGAGSSSRTQTPDARSFFGSSSKPKRRFSR
jgi:ATP-dependent RNA helicase RhlE